MNSLVTDQIRENAVISEANDHFGYSDLAKNLLEYIKEKNIVCPISLGIYGKWGTGKSVLGNFLKAEAEEQGNIFIEIDAMEFKGNDENMFEYFLYKIGEKTLKDSDFKNFFKKEKTETGFKKIWGNLKEFNLEFHGFKLPSIKEVFSGVSVRDEELCTFIDLIKSREITQGIVLIDNLDRLQPRETIIFLEKLKAFFLSDGKRKLDKFAYVILCDFDILEDEVRSLYGENVNVRDYLNKLIELPFYIPSFKPENINGFIKSLLDNEIPEAIKEDIYKIFDSAKIEVPRDIKVCLMELDMIFMIAKARGKSETYLFENLGKILTLIILKGFEPKALEFLKKTAPTITRSNTRNFVTSFHNYLFPSEQLSRDDIYKKGDAKTREIIKTSEFIFDCFPKVEFASPNNQYRLEKDLLLEILEIVDSASQKHTKDL